MTIVGTELHFVNGRVCVKVQTVANDKVIAESFQDVTPSVAQSIAMYILTD